MADGATFPRVNILGREVDRSLPTWRQSEECVELFVHFLICHHGVLLNHTGKTLYI